jgi:hypothetical protein
VRRAGLHALAHGPASRRSTICANRERASLLPDAEHADPDTPAKGPMNRHVDRGTGSAEVSEQPTAACAITSTGRHSCGSLSHVCTRSDRLARCGRLSRGGVSETSSWHVGPTCLVHVFTLPRKSSRLRTDYAEAREACRFLRSTSDEQDNRSNHCVFAGTNVQSASDGPKDVGQARENPLASRPARCSTSMLSQV